VNGRFLHPQTEEGKRLGFDFLFSELSTGDTKSFLLFIERKVQTFLPFHLIEASDSYQLFIGHSLKINIHRE
jgi:hypothetical protein